MDGYDPMKVFSSIDTQGRYAFANQAEIGRWNLSWLAQALLPLMTEAAGGDEKNALKKAESILQNYTTLFLAHYQSFLAEKLGFRDVHAEVNELSLKLLQLMAQENADYTLTFRALTDYLAPADRQPILQTVHKLSAAFTPWIQDWQALLAHHKTDHTQARQLMAEKNPVFIPRNHIVEIAIQQAMQGDYAFFNRMADVLNTPFTYREEHREFAIAPTPEQEVRQTFCGT